MLISALLVTRIDYMVASLLNHGTQFLHLVSAHRQRSTEHAES